MKIYCSGEFPPTRGSSGAAGLDLYNNGDDISIYDSRWGEIDTETHVEIPEGYVGLVIVRSSLGSQGLRLRNQVGVIDADYRGPIKVALSYAPQSEMGKDVTIRATNGIPTGWGTWPAVINPIHPRRIVIKKGERFAQLVIVPILNYEMELVNSLEELSETDRGQGGFGSTGKM